MGEEQWVRWEPSTTMVTVYLSVSWNVKWGQGLWDTQKSPFFPAKEAKPLAALNLCQKSTQLPQTPKHMFQRDILNVNNIFLAYLSQSYYTILGLGIRGDFKECCSISINDVIRWLCIFTNILIIGLHSPYCSAKDHVFWYWEVIQTLKRKRNAEHCTVSIHSFIHLANI